MIKKVTFQNSKGQKLVGVLHTPDKEGKFPAVVRLHGFRSGKDRRSSEALGEALGDDFVYLRFDFYAHGESEGEFMKLTPSEEMDDAQAAINFISKQEKVDPERIGIQGSSLGGMVAIYTTANNPKVKATVFVAAVSDFKSCFSKLEDVEEWKKQGWKYTYDSQGNKYEVGYGFFEDGCKFNLYKEAEKIKVPTLIVHGDQDKSVPIEQSQELVKHLTNPHLEIVQGANHYFGEPEHFKIMIQKSVEFFKENL